LEDRTPRCSGVEIATTNAEQDVDANLIWRKPEREVAGVVLDEKAGEPIRFD
jgi:hypothetical protein